MPHRTMTVKMRLEVLLVVVGLEEKSTSPKWTADGVRREGLHGFVASEAESNVLDG